MHEGVFFFLAGLDRRTGGLENAAEILSHRDHLDRRTGGLET